MAIAKSKIEISLPFMFEPRDYQLPLLKGIDGGYKRLLIVWHRRSGKDKTCVNIIAKKMQERVGTYYYLFPTYNQGRKVLWDGMDKMGFKFLDHFPKALVKGKPNDTEMKLRYKNGSLFQVVGVDKLDLVMGTNPIGLIFSEYSLQNPKGWDFFRPILAENEGWALFNFTPRGMNHGWKLLQTARLYSEQWYVQILTVDDTAAIKRKILAQEKLEMPEDLFLQEYYCKFIEGASNRFKRIDENIWDGDLRAIKGRQYKIGVDLGKHQDWTVLTPIDLHTWKMGKPERFNQMSWVLQKAKIEAMARRYNDAELSVDGSGIGDVIVDELEDLGLNVTPFKFTTQSREELIKNLAVKIETDKVKLPNDIVVLNEFKSMMYELTEAGRLTCKVPSGNHDDCIMSGGLAVWGLDAKIPEPEGTWLDQIKMNKEVPGDEDSLYDAL